LKKYKNIQKNLAFWKKAWYTGCCL